MKKLVYKHASRAMYNHLKNPDNKKLKKYLIIILAGLVVLFVVLVIIIFLAFGWIWNAGSSVINQNPTVNSIVENTKEQVGNLLPTVPSSAQDFIANNQIDTTKLTETYNNLPAATQQVWKDAMTRSINEAINNSVGAELNTLQQLLQTVSSL